MSSKKHRNKLKSIHIDRIKPAVVLQYGNEIGNALMETELEQAISLGMPLEFCKRVIKYKYMGYGYQFVCRWLYGEEKNIRFILPNGKIRVRNVYIYFDK